MPSREAPKMPTGRAAESGSPTNTQEQVWRGILKMISGNESLTTESKKVIRQGIAARKRELKKEEKFFTQSPNVTAHEKKRFLDTKEYIEAELDKLNAALKETSSTQSTNKQDASPELRARDVLNRLVLNERVLSDVRGKVGVGEEIALENQSESEVSTVEVQDAISGAVEDIHIVEAPEDSSRSEVGLGAETETNLNFALNATEKDTYLTSTPEAPTEQYDAVNTSIVGESGPLPTKRELKDRLSKLVERVEGLRNADAFEYNLKMSGEAPQGVITVERDVASIEDTPKPDTSLNLTKTTGFETSLTYNGNPEDAALSVGKQDNPEGSILAGSQVPASETTEAGSKRRQERQERHEAFMSPAREAQEAFKKAEEAYEKKYEEFYTKRSFIGRFFSSKGHGELENLKLERDKARVEYAGKLTESARKRMEADGRSPEYIEKALQKYNGIVRFREIVRPGTERELEIRTKALGEKGPSLVEKGVGWLVRFNKGLERTFGKTGALFIRSATAATLLTMAAAVTGSFVAGGAMAALGYGAFKLGRSVAGSLLGTTTGELVGNLYRDIFGKRAQQKATESLKTTGRRDDLSLEVLRSLDRQRTKLTSRADEATLQKKILLVRALTAMGVGATTSAAFAKWNIDAFTPGGGDYHGAGATGNIDEVSSAGPRTGLGQGGVVTGAGTGIESHSPTTPSTETASSISGSELQVSGTINNADRLVGNFGIKLHEQFPDMDKAPSSAKKLVELLTIKEGADLRLGEDHATLELGMQERGGLSSVMQPGDKIKLVNDQIILERPSTGESHILIDKGEVKGVEGSSWDPDNNATPRATVSETATESPRTVSAPTTPEQTTSATEAPTSADTTASTVTAAPEVESTIESAPRVTPAPVEAAPRAVSPEVSAPEVNEATSTDTSTEAPTGLSGTDVTPEATGDIITTPTGLRIDMSVAETFVDKDGKLIIIGGTLDDRMKEAVRVLELNRGNPDTQVFFDSTSEDPITGEPVTHLSRGRWIEGVSSPQIANEQMDDTLWGAKVPSPEDAVRRANVTP